MPYEEYLDRIHEYNHRIVVAKRIAAKRFKQERIENILEIIAFCLLGIVCIGSLYFLVALGGTYR